MSTYYQHFNHVYNSIFNHQFNLDCGPRSIGRGQWAEISLGRNQEGPKSMVTQLGYGFLSIFIVSYINLNCHFKPFILLPFWYLFCYATKHCPLKLWLEEAYWSLRISATNYDEGFIKYICIFLLFSCIIWIHTLNLFINSSSWLT